LKAKLDEAEYLETIFVEQEQKVIETQKTIDLLEEKVMNIEITKKKLSSSLSKMKGSSFNLSNLLKEKKKRKEKKNKEKRMTIS
jgi:hypothetical protein